MDRYKEGIDFEWVKADNGNYKTRRFFTKAEKEAKKAPKMTKEQVKSETAKPVQKKKSKTSSAPTKSKRPPIKSDTVTLTKPKKIQGTLLDDDKVVKAANKAINSTASTTKRSDDPLVPKAEPTLGKRFSYEEWKSMSKARRRELGLPLTTLGWQNQNMGKNKYNKGGLVKANCGASMKPTQKWK